MPTPTDEPITCTPKQLPPDVQARAVAFAVSNNPANAPPHGLATAVAALTGGEVEQPAPEHLAVLVGSYWGPGGVHLTVGFMEQTPQDLIARLLSHMNAWGEWANVQFSWTTDLGSAQVRITRELEGYWSYLGTGILTLPPSEPTMCLQGFTMSYPESEFRRVVRHETGHTLGFPHEHARRQIVQLLDRRKTLAYFRRTQGWSNAMIQQQILTPLEERSVMGTPGADVSSIMTYSFPAQCTKSGKAILGGADIDPSDQAFAARLYPKPTGQAPPPPVMAPAL